MLRLSRQLTTALLWLAIALLPLRGVAATMPMVMGTGPAHMVSMLPAAASAATPQGCHTGTGEQALEEADAALGSVTHACSLCDLCYSAAATLASPVLAVSPFPAGPPRVDTMHDFVCAVLDTPERPPRLLRA